MKSEFVPSKEEVEKQRKEILFEINKSSNEIIKQRNKRILFITIIVLIIVFFIKIVFGTIVIPNVFKYPSNKTRFYKVTLNGELISSESFLTQKIPVIPYLVYLEREYFDSFIKKGDNNASDYNGESLEKIIIDIDSYSCYFKGHQTKCKDENDEMIKNDDTKYTKLEIWRYTNPVEKMYDGKFINDITPYIKDKGKGAYTVTIYTNHPFIETKVSFRILIGRK